MDPAIETQVEAWLSRMSLAQKVGQMTQGERQHITPEQVRDFHIGSVLSGGGSAPGENRPADWVAMNDAYWAASVESGDGLLPTVVPLRSLTLSSLSESGHGADLLPLPAGQF